MDIAISNVTTDRNIRFIFLRIAYIKANNIIINTGTSPTGVPGSIGLPGKVPPPNGSSPELRRPDMRLGEVLLSSCELHIDDIGATVLVPTDVIVVTCEGVCDI